VLGIDDGFHGVGKTREARDQFHNHAENRRVFAWRLRVVHPARCSFRRHALLQPTILYGARHD
jgi:hypothetical protein